MFLFLSAANPCHKIKGAVQSRAAESTFSLTHRKLNIVCVKQRVIPQTHTV